MNNVIKFRKKPKTITLNDIDSIGILFKNGGGVIVPKRIHKKILDLLTINGLNTYIDK